LKVRPQDRLSSLLWLVAEPFYEVGSAALWGSMTEKLQEGDTIAMQDEVSAIQADGPVTVRLQGLTIPSPHAVSTYRSSLRSPAKEKPQTTTCCSRPLLAESFLDGCEDECVSFQVSFLGMVPKVLQNYISSFT